MRLRHDEAQFWGHIWWSLKHLKMKVMKHTSKRSILALKPRGYITRSPKQRISVAPQKGLMSSKFFSKSLCGRAGISLHAWAHISLSTWACTSLHVGVQRGMEHHGGLRSSWMPLVAIDLVVDNREFELLRHILRCYIHYGRLIVSELKGPLLFVPCLL